MSYRRCGSALEPPERDGTGLNRTRFAPGRDMNSLNVSALGAIGTLVVALFTAAIVHPVAPTTMPPQHSSIGDIGDRVPDAAEWATIRDFEPAAGPRLIVEHEPTRPTVDWVTEEFGRMGYDLDRIGAGAAPVPRIFLARFPDDLDRLRETDHRKALFFKTMLPLVLHVNEEILNDRRRLWSVRVKLGEGRNLGPVDRLWMVVAAERYGVAHGDLDGLARRMDVVPPSLALAQAAEESGWGTSRFARAGNAVFGQWTYSDEQGIVPLRREQGKTHSIRAFSSLLDSVRAYIHNLNTHRAYRELRQTRARMRQDGAPIDGAVLAGALTRYSQRGGEYVDSLRLIISANSLRRFDDARLADRPASIDPLI